MSVLIKGGRVITAADDYVADIFIEDERISLIGESLDLAADTAAYFALFDVQMVTPATAPLGVVEIPRGEYFRRLGKAVDLALHW